MRLEDKINDAKAELVSIKDLSSEMLRLLEDGAGGKVLIVDAVLEAINNRAWRAISSLEDAEERIKNE